MFFKKKMKYNKILKKINFTFFWFFFYTPIKYFQTSNSFYIFLVSNNGFLSKVSNFVFDLKRVIRILCLNQPYSLLICSSNFIYSQVIHNLSYNSHKTNKNLFVIFLNIRFIVRLLSKFKMARFIIAGLVDFSQSSILFDYKILLNTKSFFNIYFFSKFFVKYYIR